MNPVLEALLNQVSKSEVVDQGDLKEASRLILGAVMQGLQVDRCGIWLYQDALSGIACFYLVDTFIQSTEDSLVLHRNDYPAYFAALDEDRIIVANDAVRAVETCEFAQGYLDVLGITSMLDTPIRHMGKTVGIICSEHRGDIRTWNDDEKVFAGVLSDLFGRALSAREKLDYELKLKEINQTLENKVAERTAHLEKSLAEMQLLQRQLIESEKLASLGNLVAGIAHEVNTPLGIALTATSHLKDSLAQLNKHFLSHAMTREHLTQYIETANSAISMSEDNLYRAATLISNFKRTSADQNHFENEEIYIKSYIEKVASTLIPITKKKHVALNIKGDDVKKFTLPGALAQIITNLVSNSCHHGFAQSKQDATITIEIIPIDDEQLEILYQDNGSGIAEDDLAKIFEPFYTTSRSQGGTGLGLSIVHTLATQNLKGSIDVKSIHDLKAGGTEFSIKF